MPFEVFFGLERIKTDPAGVLTVGAFDGLHLGHRAILEEVKREAKQRGGRTATVTFEPHPQLVLKKSGLPAIQILTTIEEKIARFEELGVDRLIVIPFTLAFAQTPSEVFVREILYHRLGMQAMVIGHDHGFGKNREGDVATLTRLGEELGFAVHELPPWEIEGAVMSSSRIRQALLQGQVEKSGAWLGHPYALSGRITRGEERGRAIGFPTLNLTPLHPHKLIPAQGVYAVRARLPEGEFGGMMNIGRRPTFDGGSCSLEVHVFDFARQAYDEICEVKFIARLREERKFDSVEALQAQLQHDKSASLHALSGNVVQKQNSNRGSSCL
ncbi:MAG: bifunctional riboflavin kinase/FAD synthetase [bacterium]